ncbi:hypothetical protein DFQ03_3471 [Maribacter caenipelagi]|uniref:Glycerophosphoryl diester phosphodiesterase family protein n=1 Tax=Maribacter caenipelagi TaxID=1447781 RepID=A0A4R7CW65_9FLAO|nr:hypothetical protein [Maribacter caenipelagi]TDS12082.1 hypothetical protein DFQ03_3471 [Maribacter caenipelagi]
MNLENLTHHIKSKPDLDFGTIFSRSIDLFKKVWLQGFIILLLTFVVILPFYIVLYIPMIAMGITDPEALRYNELPPMAAIAMAILFPFIAIGVTTFALALNAAFLKMCREKDLGKESGDDYFYYFKEGRIGKVFILALYTFGLSILGALACGVGMFYVMVPVSLIPAFLAFSNDLSPLEMVKASFTLGNKNWLVIFGLVLVMSFVAQLGFFLCCVGVLFTAMLAKVPIYYMYKDGVGFDELI